MNINKAAENLSKILESKDEPTLTREESNVLNVFLKSKGTLDHRVSQNLMLALARFQSLDASDSLPSASSATKKAAERIFLPPSQQNVVIDFINAHTPPTDTNKAAKDLITILNSSKKGELSSSEKKSLKEFLTIDQPLTRENNFNLTNAITTRIESLNKRAANFQKDDTLLTKVMARSNSLPEGELKDEKEDFNYDIFPDDEIVSPTDTPLPKSLSNKLTTSDSTKKSPPERDNDELSDTASTISDITLDSSFDEDTSTSSSIPSSKSDENTSNPLQFTSERPKKIFRPDRRNTGSGYTSPDSNNSFQISNPRAQKGVKDAAGKLKKHNDEISQKHKTPSPANSPDREPLREDTPPSLTEDDSNIRIRNFHAKEDAKYFMKPKKSGSEKKPKESDKI